MTAVTAERVLGWAAEWVYVPEGSPTVETEEYLLVAQPLTWADPTAAFRIDSSRTPAELVEEVMTAAADLGRDAVTFWTHAGTRPDGLVDELVARGAPLLEELAVLARPLGAGLPDLDVPADVEVRAVTDLDAMRDEDHVGYTVFGGAPESEEELAAHLARRDPTRDAGYVAYRDGVAVGTAGVAFAGEVARLWGGSVLEEARGTGVYRALLASRLTAAREHGCAAALVKGRLATSAPTLLRAGFTAYGEERGYRLSG